MNKLIAWCLGLGNRQILGKETNSVFESYFTFVVLAALNISNPQEICLHFAVYLTAFFIQTELLSTRRDLKQLKDITKDFPLICVLTTFVFILGNSPLSKFSLMAGIVVTVISFTLAYISTGIIEMENKQNNTLTFFSYLCLCAFHLQVVTILRPVVL